MSFFAEVDFFNRGCDISAYKEEEENHGGKGQVWNQTEWSRVYLSWKCVVEKAALDTPIQQVAVSYWNAEEQAANL